jgi:rare lipoprotein A
MSKSLSIYILAAAFLALQSSHDAYAADTASGKATVYSDSFAGKKTATGTKFRQSAPTAASNKLPLGSKVRIKNVKNGKTSTVTITDRTSKHSNAAVDLSRSTANKLGIKGTAPVTAKVVAKPNH